MARGVAKGGAQAGAERAAPQPTIAALFARAAAKSQQRRRPPPPARPPAAAPAGGSAGAFASKRVAAARPPEAPCAARGHAAPSAPAPLENAAELAGGDWGQLEAAPRAQRRAGETDAEMGEVAGDACENGQARHGRSGGARASPASRRRSSPRAQPDEPEGSAPSAEAPADEEADDDSDSDASGSSDGEASAGEGAQEAGDGYDEHGLDAEGLSKYERERLARIAANHARMEAMLGHSLRAAEVAAAASKPKARARPRKRAKRSEGEEPAQLLRRSARQRGTPAAAGAVAAAVDASAAVAVVPVPPPEPVYDPAEFDSSAVVQYDLTDSTRWGGDGGGGAALPASGELPQRLRLAARGRECWDPTLKRVYSVDRAGELLVAAGKDGRATVFALDGLGGGDEGASADAEGDAVVPLLSWKAHGGWVGDVQWVTGGDGRVLTAANDKAVRLWDARSASARNGAPRELARAAGLHGGGIFSLHERAGKLLTTSKDGCVVLSALREADVEHLWSLDDAHSVGKCVRWRPNQTQPAIFASCGAEGDVRVEDVRVRAGGSNGSGAAAFPGAHALGATFVAWSPAAGCEHLLATAGMGKRLLLFDVRKAGAGASPLQIFEGHAKPKNGGERCKGMYSPAFAAGGAVLVCPGENSERLSLYRVSDGATLSRGVVGYDATALLGGGADRNAPIVAAAPGGALQAFFLEVSERPTQAL